MPVGDNLYNAAKANLEWGPDSAGVYSLYLNGGIIYFGRAEGGSNAIKGRLRGDHGRLSCAHCHDRPGIERSFFPG